MPTKKQITNEEQIKDYNRLQKEFLRYSVKYNYMIKAISIACHDGNWAIGISHDIVEYNKTISGGFQ